MYRRADGSWCAQVTFRSDEGRLKRTTVYAKTETEARAKKRVIDRQREDGLPVRTSRSSTVREYGNRWITTPLVNEVAVKRLSRGTADSYGSNWTLHIDPYLGQLRLDALSPHHIRSWLTRKAEETSARGRRRSDRSTQYLFAIPDVLTW